MSSKKKIFDMGRMKTTYSYKPTVTLPPDIQMLMNDLVSQIFDINSLVRAYLRGTPPKPQREEVMEGEGRCLPE